MGVDFEFPDEAGYPDGVGTLDQGTRVLVQEVAAGAPHVDVPWSDYELQLLDEDRHSRYAAYVDGEEAASLPYRRFGDRLVLLDTTVRKDLRGQGVATEFIARVLDDVRNHGLTVTLYCPVVRAFVDRYPQYADIVDPARPGVTSDSVKAAATSEQALLAYDDAPTEAEGGSGG
jgi:predicted GNAT family acetyltransferase